MIINAKNIRHAFSAAFVITLLSSGAHAFPLLCSDPSRLAAAFQQNMHEVQMLKQEIESNLLIIKQIQNGGYAAAGAMLFGKIQNGDYDRFGKSLSTLRDNSQSMVQNVKDRKAVSEREQELIEQGLDARLAQAKARQEAAEREAKRQAAKAQRGNNVFQSSFEWLERNRVAGSVEGALRGVDSGNRNQILDGIFGAVGNTAGNDSVLGKASGALGDLTEGTLNSIEKGGNVLDVVEDVVNGQVMDGLTGMADAYGQAKSESAEAAAAEQAEKERQRKEMQDKIEESAKEAMKELQAANCNKCKEDAAKAGKDVGLTCFAYCSN